MASTGGPGAVNTPMRLGGGKPEGLARPGGGSKLVDPGSMDIPKVARPGFAEKTVPSGGTPPKVARPGGAQGAPSK